MDAYVALFASDVGRAVQRVEQRVEVPTDHSIAVFKKAIEDRVPTWLPAAIHLPATQEGLRENGRKNCWVVTERDAELEDRWRSGSLAALSPQVMELLVQPYRLARIVAHGNVPVVVPGEATERKISLHHVSWLGSRTLKREAA